MRGVKPVVVFLLGPHLGPTFSALSRLVEVGVNVFQRAMNIHNEAEVECFLVQADIHVHVFMPDSSPEILGAVSTSTVNAVCAEGMAP